MRKLLSVLFSTLQGRVRGGLLFLLFFASAINIYASDIKVGGIWYDFNSSTKTASVTYRGSAYDRYEGEYSGAVVIPETVTYNGTTYSVTNIGGDAFAGCSSLTSVTIGNSVTSIGEWAFLNCSSLTSVTIPNSVTSIGDNAFRYCSSLTSVTIPNSVTSIGDYAFYECSSLTSVTIPNSVTSIGKWVFADCSSLTSVTIPNSVTSIGGQAFLNCSSLTSVTIPNSVTSIGYAAFASCSSLTSVTIPNSVTSIGDYAFDGCSSLTSVTINSGAIVSKDYSYDSNISHIFGSKVTEYIIGESVTSIGESAFYDCSSLTSVTIPNSVTSIGSSAFYGCSSLTKTNYTGDIADWCNIKFGSSSANPMYYSHNFYINDQEIKDLVIPESVTSIGDRAFYSCSSLTSVTIGESVTSIGYYAFRNCSSLTSVTIPNSVTSIGDDAFYECSSLTSVTIGESVTSIGDDAFYGCSSLTSVTINSNAIVSKAYSYDSNISHIFGSKVTEYIIGEDVKGIGSSAFAGCSKLTSVTIPNSVTSIGDYAFCYCSSLTSVTIPNSVTSIGNNAFYSCSKLTSVTIPNSVTSIGSSAFAGCSSLTSVTIPNSVTSIGDGAFYDCSSLTSVTIDESVTSIGDYAFSLCSSLTSVTIPNSVTSIGSSAFYGCSSLTSVTIPNSVTSIGDGAFYDCFSLTSVTIGESVKSIGVHAFYGCEALTSIVVKAGNTTYDSRENCNAIIETTSNTLIAGCQKTIIPNSVTSIGSSAFKGCSSLTSVTIPNSVTSIGEYAFDGCFFLTSVTIGKSVTSIGEEAFKWCSSLTSVTINSDAIVNKAYSYDSNISHIFGSQVTEYIIGESVTSIGSSAFKGCSSLTSVTIPNSVTSIGEYAFDGCSSLTKTNYTGDIAGWCNIKFYSGSANPMYCSHNFYINDQEIKDLVIPNSVTSIGGSAFYGCSSLTSVTIPNSVTSIGAHAFNSCSSLTSMTIPNSVTSIGSSAFKGCSSLTSITCEAENPPTVGSNTFYGVSKLIPVYVPCGCVEAYKSDNGWKYFTNIQEPLAEYSIEVDVNDNIMGTAKVDKNNACGSQISATPNFGYHFVQWNDGNTDNPRTLELTQDTILIAEFAPNTYTITTVSSDTQRGTTQGDTTVNYLEYITISASASYGYHFVQWNDGNSDNPRQVQVTGNTTYTATFDKNTYAISLSCNEEQGSVEGVTSAKYLDTVTISATPNIGYHFVQWSDGNTDNPRTLELTQDTILTAEFAQSFSGQCGDSLYWELVDTTLHITGKGEMYDYKSNTAPWKLLVSSIKSLIIAEDVTSIERSAFSGCSALESVVWSAKNYANPANKEVAPFFDIRSQIKSFTFGEAVEHIPVYLCYGMDKLTSVTTPNSLKTIGTSAFEGCVRLAKISLGTGLEEIAANAFAGCTRLYDIYVYATYPPFAEESSFANYNVYVYIPCEYQRDYILDVVWGNFKFIECIESEDVTTEGVVVTPSTNDVTITWPTEAGADSYTIVIKKGDTVFCTLTFNADGQLLNIAFAPSRDGNHPAQYAEQAGNGYRFTVTGLEEGTHYAYNIDVRDAANTTIKSHTGEFTTESTTAVENTHTPSPMTNCQKIIRNGQFVIVRDGVEYTIMGQKL